MTESELDVIERQVEAYNNHDLEAFVACYAPGVELLDGDGNVIAEGRDGLRHLYAMLFQSSPALRCTIAHRIRVGRFVVDEEEVDGAEFEGLPPSFRAVVTYRVDDKGFIDRVIAILDQ